VPHVPPIWIRPCVDVTAVNIMASKFPLAVEVMSKHCKGQFFWDTLYSITYTSSVQITSLDSASSATKMSYGNNANTCCAKTHLQATSR